MDTLQGHSKAVIALATAENFLATFERQYSQADLRTRERLLTLKLATISHFKWKGIAEVGI